ncbi:MAG: acyl-CoA dehydrogenase, partial [Deltaproteobacteria bacterium]
MIEWNEQQLLMRDAIRRFVNEEIVPIREELEHGDTPPYDVIRKMVKTFAIDEMARTRFAKQIEAEKAGARGEKAAPAPEEASGGRGEAMAMQMIPVIELCRHCPGIVTAMGVSMGLTPAAIMAKGTIAQKERWALDLMTFDKIGAWAITEPDSGSDAFGGMKSTARRDGDGYVLNGTKTFITNGPYADTIVFICKLDDGSPPDERRALSFVVEKGMPGLTQSKPLRKMGLHSSPTGMLFLEDVRVGREHLLGESEDVSAREGAKDTFSLERTGVAAMALGMVEQALELCIDYARTRVQFGRPIGEFQLIQLKLAKMEVARMNIQNLVFRQIELAEKGIRPTLAEASAMKLYSAQAAVEVCLEAVQLFGGNGYMAEYQVEQLCRDAKVLQIYAGTDEIQTSQIARSLLA